MGSSERMIMDIGQPNWESPEQELDKNIDDTLNVRLMIKKIIMSRFKVTMSNPTTVNLAQGIIGIEVSIKFKFNDIIHKYTNGKKYPVITFADKNDQPETNTGIGYNSSTVYSKSVRCSPNMQFREEGGGFTATQFFPIRSMLDRGVYGNEFTIAFPDIGLLIPAIDEWYDSNDFISVEYSAMTFIGIRTDEGGKVDETRSIGPLYDTETNWPVEPKLSFPRPTISSIQSPSSFTPEYCVSGKKHLIYSTPDFHQHLDQLLNKNPLPVMSYSLPHNNHSGSENGIKYYSTRPPSKVSDDVNKKNFQGLINIINKLTRRKQHENK